jgi:hypothetical protein
MTEPIRINDLIELRSDVPEHNLMQGQIGCVRQIFSDDEFEVEFAEWVNSIGKFRLRAAQVQALHDLTTIDEAAFWHLIEQAKAESGGAGERQVELLVSRLAERPVADMLTFRDWIWHFKDIAYTNELWVAAYIIGGGCSDDGFTDFRAGLIAQGKTIFEAALRDPETLAEVLPEGDEGRLERMNYVVSLAHEKKFDKKEPIFRGRHPMPTLTGVQWEENTVDALYPKLAAKFS